MPIHAVDRPCAICGREADPATFRRIWPRVTPQHGTVDLCDRCEHDHPEFQFVRGNVCKAHFNNRSASMADKAACVDCQAAEQNAANRIQRNHTIDPDQPYGQHIMLTCRNHRELRWNTKNIDFIGARSIFFASGRTGAIECDCSARDLEVVKDES
jgi:hypothetical protein